MFDSIRALFDRLARRSPRDVAALAASVERTALQAVRCREPSSSHLGGDPMLPPGVDWPRRDGRPLRFLARLSLAELQAGATTAWLPDTGALLFFYDDQKQPWGFDPADRGGWSVLHVPEEPAAPAVPQEPPADQLPHLPVKLRRIAVLPSADRPEVKALRLSGDEFNGYFDLAEERFGGLPKHQVLGVPSPIQADAMELECQMASNGIYCGNADGYSSHEAKDLAAGAVRWRLLFQMDSDDDLGVMWGDIGMLYFWVEQQAAARADFSNVWLILQCH